MLLAQRSAFATGGAGRLGRVIAATLQREGAKVVSHQHGEREQSASHLTPSISAMASLAALKASTPAGMPQ
jgi:NAD(P)-dependent dehydrogenase (short-subunit alcohol dehydrogenase family)